MDDAVPVWLDPRLQPTRDTIVLDHGWPDGPPPGEDRHVGGVGAWESQPPLPGEPGRPARPKLLVDIREAAQMLGCGRSLLYELIAAGELQVVKVGRLSRIPVATLEEFVARKVAERRMSGRSWWEDSER